MAQPSVRNVAALVVALAVLGLLAVAWFTRAPAPPASEGAAPRAPGPAPGPPPSPRPPPAAPLASGCPPELAVEILPRREFSDAWAMCRLFGNHDEASGRSRAAGQVARAALSRGFRDGAAERHVLVVAREAAGADGEVLRGRGASLELAAHVFERGEAGWRFATSGGVGEPSPSGQMPRLEVLRAGPARHALLVGGARQDEATLHALSELGVPVLLPQVPLGGSNAGECQPPRCYAWTAELGFERGRDPDYDDVVLRLSGTRPDDDERVWPVEETQRWVRRDGRNLPQ